MDGRESEHHSCSTEIGLHSWWGNVTHTLTHKLLLRTWIFARQTVCNTVINFNATGWVEQHHRGAWQPKIDGKMVDYLIDKIEAKPTSMIKELWDQKWVDMQDKPVLSHQAISRKLDGFLYMLKSHQKWRWRGGSLLTGWWEAYKSIKCSLMNIYGLKKMRVLWLLIR